MKTLPTIEQAKARLIAQGIPKSLLSDLTGVTSTRFAGWMEWGYVAHCEAGGIWCLALCKYYPKASNEK